MLVWLGILPQASTCQLLKQGGRALIWWLQGLVQLAEVGASAPTFKVMGVWASAPEASGLKSPFQTRLYVRPKGRTSDFANRGPFSFEFLDLGQNQQDGTACSLRVPVARLNWWSEKRKKELDLRLALGPAARLCGSVDSVTSVVSSEEALPQRAPRAQRRLGQS